MRWQSALLRLAQQSSSLGRSASSQHQQLAACAAAFSQCSLQQQPDAHWRAPPLPAPQPAVSLQGFQPARQFFSLPGSGNDLSKHYRERRLIGCVLA